MTTYTNKVKREAINIMLSRLFSGCNEYTNDALGARDCVIEPDIVALNVFRLRLCNLGESTRTENFVDLKKEIENVFLPFVHDTGEKYGHVNYNYTTGTWGVRYHELKDILKVLELTDVPYLFGKTGIVYDTRVKVVEVKIGAHELWLKLQPDNREVNSWQADISYENIKNNDYHGLVFD